MPAYNGVQSGELAGSATALRMPDIPCRMVMFRAATDNAGLVYIGGAGVTKADGTTDITTGVPLSAGDYSPWFEVANVDAFYRICDNATDDCFYIALG